MTLGDRIKQARKARRLSLEKVAKLMGVSRQLVWQWERYPGKKRCSDPRKHIERLCSVLEVPYAHFYGDDPPRESIQSKFWRLEPPHQVAIEAAIDGLLAQRLSEVKPKRVK